MMKVCLCVRLEATMSGSGKVVDLVFLGGLEVAIAVAQV